MAGQSRIDSLHSGSWALVAGVRNSSKEDGKQKEESQQNKRNHEAPKAIGCLSGCPSFPEMLDAKLK
jgi:hypothetical protein